MDNWIQHLRQLCNICCSCFPYYYSEFLPEGTCCFHTYRWCKSHKINSLSSIRQMHKKIRKHRTDDALRNAHCSLFLSGMSIGAFRHLSIYRRIHFSWQCFLISSNSFPWLMLSKRSTISNSITHFILKYLLLAVAMVSSADLLGL